MAAPPAPTRTQTLLDGPWRFAPDAPATGPEQPAFDDRAWAEVRTPHTWGKDHRRAAWYRTRFTPPAGGRTYLVFEGVATIADVYVDGEHAGQHRGAYTRFVVDTTPHVTPGREAVVAVRVSNAPEDTADTLPSGTSKTLYWPWGGIYRKAWVLHTPDVHVDPTDHGSPGVFATITNVSGAGAEVAVRTLVRNTGAGRSSVEVRGRLLDPDGREAAAWKTVVDVAPGATATAQFGGRVRQPRLWGPGHPHLYTLAVELFAGDRRVDAVEQRVGFRDFQWTGTEFRLNGEPIALRGIGKHQETEHRLAAIGDDDIREDFAHLRELGVNTVRLAHYPHAQLAYDLADEMGLLVWAENGHSNPGKSHGTGSVITREMVRQNYNHPSIVMWSAGNETGYVRVNRYAAILQEEDPTRPVTYASNTGSKGKRRYPDLDFIAHNTYRGWYRGMPWEFEEKALEMQLISENGAGAVISHHTDYAAARHVVDRFEPEEYRQLMAEIQYQVVFRDHPAKVPMYLVWILRDFSIDKFKGRNTKGLLTYSNFRKDAFYLYQAFLRPGHPVLHITSKTWFLRDAAPDNGVKVYSNLPALHLVVNGEPQGTRRNGDYRLNWRRIDNVFHWPARLRPGRNEIVVSDGQGREDRAVVYSSRGAGAEHRSGGIVRDLVSSNPRSPAWFIDQPVRAQWPFYAEFDATADNTFDRLPAAVDGAGWIATPRLSKPGRATTLAFTAAADAEVFVMATEDAAYRRALAAAGFRDTGETTQWRDDDLALVPCRLYSRRATAGERVTVPAASVDAVVLVRHAP